MAVVVVLLEDTGALLGLVFALGGVVLANVTGNARWDALGSLAILCRDTVAVVQLQCGLYSCKHTTRIKESDFAFE